MVDSELTTGWASNWTSYVSIVLVILVAIIFSIKYRLWKRDVASGAFVGTFGQYLSKDRIKIGTSSPSKFPTTATGPSTGSSSNQWQPNPKIAAEQHIASLVPSAPPFTLLANPAAAPSEYALIPLYAQGEVYILGVPNSGAPNVRTSYQTNLPLLIPQVPVDPPTLFYLELDITELPTAATLAVGYAQKPWSPSWYPGEAGISVGFWTSDMRVHFYGTAFGNAITDVEMGKVRSLGLCLEYENKAVRPVINGRSEEHWRVAVPRLPDTVDLWPTVGTDTPGVKFRLLWDGKRVRWNGPGGVARRLDTGWRFFEGREEGYDTFLADAPPDYVF